MENRANLDLAFGKIFTQLDIAYRNKPLETVEEDRGKVQYFMPLSFRILVTLNTYDRSLLFSLGYAFMHRFAFIPVESLLKEKALDSYEGREITIPERMRTVLQKDSIKQLKDKTKDAIRNHFLATDSSDKPYIFSEFSLKDKNEIDMLLKKLKIGDMDILDALLYIGSYWLRNHQLRLC